MGGKYGKKLRLQFGEPVQLPGSGVQQGRKSGLIDKVRKRGRGGEKKRKKDQ